MRVFEARNLSRRFVRRDSGIDALDGVSFHVEEGEFSAVVGPSGCGKTTLLHILGLLDEGFDGGLLFKGRPVSGLGHARRCRLRLAEIGFVFQRFQLLGALNLLDNVALPHWWLHGSMRKARSRARELLTQLGLGERISHSTDRLSVGEMQRAAVARALVNEPSVILADEPTGSLDARSTETVVELLRRIHREGRTLVVVTHNREVAREAGRTLALRFGRLVEGPEAGPEPAPGGAGENAGGLTGQRKM